MSAPKEKGSRPLLALLVFIPLAAAAAAWSLHSRSARFLA